jgi:hypothetical protein
MEKSLKQAAAELGYFTKETLPENIVYTLPNESTDMYFETWKKAEYFIKNLDGYEIGVFSRFVERTSEDGTKHVRHDGSQMLIKKAGRDTVYNVGRDRPDQMYYISPLPVGLSNEERYNLINMHVEALDVKRPARISEFAFNDRKLTNWMDYADACYAAVKRDADIDAAKRLESKTVIANFCRSLPEHDYYVDEVRVGSYYTQTRVETPRFSVTFTMGSNGHLSHTVVYKSTLDEITRMENALTLNK